MFGNDDRAIGLGRDGDFDAVGIVKVVIQIAVGRNLERHICVGELLRDGNADDRPGRAIDAVR
jgi:hypothetical protein